jgi:hypothetical protein
MNKEYFSKGETIESFKETLGDNLDKYQALKSELTWTEDDKIKLAALPRGLKVVVIAEPWSGDVLYNLPVLELLAIAVDWDLKVFRRDQGNDLISSYLKDGIYKSIPVFIFYDEDFNEIGHMIERAQTATKVIDQEFLKLKRRLREENKAEWRRDTLEELYSLVNPDS